MNATNNQTQLLELINKKLERGDITEIAKRTENSKSWVSKVLSLSCPDCWDLKIVEEATKIIKSREQVTENLIKELSSQPVPAV